MSLSGVRTGLKTALASVGGLRVYDFEADAPESPAAVVRMPDSIDPRAVLGSGWNYDIAVQLLLSRADDRGADGMLEDLLAETGSTSIVAALRTDPTLGGACMSADVTLVDSFGVIPVGSVPMLSCRLIVEVLT